MPYQQIVSTGSEGQFGWRMTPSGAGLVSPVDIKGVQVDVSSKSEEQIRHEELIQVNEKILIELRILNKHQEVITGEEIKEIDIMEET